MSRAAYGQWKQGRRQCQSCRARKARFRYRGIVKADRDHTLCFECFRAERDRYRAKLLANIASPRPLKVLRTNISSGSRSTHTIEPNSSTPCR